MTVAELTNKSDHDLFSKLCAQTHALNHLLNCASLRIRGHSYQLPEYSTDLYKKSFLIRCLSLSSEIVFGFAALYCTSFRLCFPCLLFDVRLSHLINITYLYTYIVSARRNASAYRSLPEFKTYSSLLVCASAGTDARRDRGAADKRTDTVPFHRPRSANCTGSADKCEFEPDCSSCRRLR